MKPGIERPGNEPESVSILVFEIAVCLDEITADNHSPSLLSSPI